MLTKINPSFRAGTEFGSRDLHRLEYWLCIWCCYLVLWILQGSVCLVVFGKCDWLKAVTCIWTKWFKVQEGGDVIVAAPVVPGLKWTQSNSLGKIKPFCFASPFWWLF